MKTEHCVAEESRTNAPNLQVPIGIKQVKIYQKIKLVLGQIKRTLWFQSSIHAQPSFQKNSLKY
jgi:hypothetical protein